MPNNFFVLFPWLASLRHFVPDIHVEVCDFGPAAPQRTFLARKGLPLVVPGALAKWPRDSTLLRIAGDRDQTKNFV